MKYLSDYSIRFFISIYLMMLTMHSNSENHPFLAHSDQFGIFAYMIDADELKPYVPANVPLKVDENNLVLTALEVVKNNYVSGIENYAGAFFVVDIDGAYSKDGMPGHMPVWGQISNQQALDKFVKEYGYPYTLNVNINIEFGDTFRFILGDKGKPVLDLKVRPVSEEFSTATGEVNILGLKNGKYIQGTVPYISHGLSGKIEKFENNANKKSVLSLIKNKEPLWYSISRDQNFSYSAPIEIDLK